MSTTEAKTAKPGQYLTFMLNSQFYGVAIGTVREINRLSDITPVPQTPPYVAGVMNLRGKVIPVVNLCMKLQIPSQTYTKETCIIVIETIQDQVGMIVDKVSGVIELISSQIETTPHLGGQNQCENITGLGKLDDKVIVLLDIIKMLSHDAQFKLAS